MACFMNVNPVPWQWKCGKAGIWITSKNVNTLVKNAILPSKHIMVIRCCNNVAAASQTFSQRHLTMTCWLRYKQVRGKQYNFINESKFCFEWNVCILQTVNRDKPSGLFLYFSHLRVIGIIASITCITWTEVVWVWILHQVEKMLILLLTKVWTVTWAFKHFSECLLLSKRWADWRKWHVYVACNI